MKTKFKKVMKLIVDNFSIVFWYVLLLIAAFGFVLDVYRGEDTFRHFVFLVISYFSIEIIKIKKKLDLVKKKGK